MGSAVLGAKTHDPRYHELFMMSRSNFVVLIRMIGDGVRDARFATTRCHFVGVFAARIVLRFRTSNGDERPRQRMR